MKEQVVDMGLDKGGKLFKRLASKPVPKSMVSQASGIAFCNLGPLRYGAASI